jgi:hypothetical protein
MANEVELEADSTVGRIEGRRDEKDGLKVGGRTRGAGDGTAVGGHDPPGQSHACDWPDFALVRDMENDADRQGLLNIAAKYTVRL